jgi:hypothetical protein
MSFMIEVYYPMPRDDRREEMLTDDLRSFGGQLTYREESSSSASRTVCLTYEFADLPSAEGAAAHMRGHGEHVEGPQEYGADEP